MKVDYHQSAPTLTAHPSTALPSPYERSHYPLPGLAGMPPSRPATSDSVTESSALVLKNGGGSRNNSITDNWDNSPSHLYHSNANSSQNDHFGALPSATTPSGLLSLKSPMYTDAHGGGPLNLSPTTALFIKNGLPSGRFSYNKRLGGHIDSPATPSLFGIGENHNGSSAHLGLQMPVSHQVGSDGGDTWSSQHYWSSLSSDNKNGMTTTSATFPSDPAWEHSQSGRIGGESHANGGAHQGNGHIHGPALYSGSFSPLNGSGRHGLNGMAPPTPRGMAPPPPFISSRNPRSSGLTYHFQDSPQGGVDANRQSSMSQGQHSSSELTQHPNVFPAPPTTTLGRPPLSARAPRGRRGTAHEDNDARVKLTWNASDQRSVSPAASQSPGSDGAVRSQRSHTTSTFFTPADGRYASDEAKWAAVQAREPRASAAFFYCVLTTKIFCRTTCPSRRPVKENICFVNTAAEAAALGYRACKRCKPDVKGGDPHEERQEVLINQVKDRLLQAIVDGGKGKAVKGKGLKYIAEELSVSHWHLHRCFKKRVGTTPEAWAKAQVKRLRGNRKNSGGGASETSGEGDHTEG